MLATRGLRHFPRTIETFRLPLTRYNPNIIIVMIAIVHFGRTGLRLAETSDFQVIQTEPYPVAQRGVIQYLRYIQAEEARVSLRVRRRLIHFPASTRCDTSIVRATLATTSYYCAHHRRDSACDRTITMYSAQTQRHVFYTTTSVTETHTSFIVHTATKNEQSGNDSPDIDSFAGGGQCGLRSDEHEEPFAVFGRERADQLLELVCTTLPHNYTM